MNIFPLIINEMDLIRIKLVITVFVRYLLYQILLSLIDNFIKSVVAIPNRLALTINGNPGEETQIM